MGLLHRIRTLFSRPAPEVRIATIINYCSNDYRFLRACVQQASLFSSQVLVPFSDHFFDGLPENLALLKQSEQENPEARFLFFPFEAGHEAQYYVTFARWFALQEVADEVDYVLFLDADEVVDGQAFLDWKQQFHISRYKALKLANYYYFREPHWQAEVWEDSPLLIRKELLQRDWIQHFDDRQQPWNLAPEPKERLICGADGKPMVHHYSWVRTREEMLRKVQSWGHNHERNWVALVEQEFAGEFSGKDFVHGYPYQKVKPFIDLASK